MSADVLTRLTRALADRYRIDRELGAGGMATVYLAHDLKHERDVAIKVLHPDLGAALGADRFLAEIKTTAKLQHPHILPLLDSGAADGLLYYVMPYVRGETLRARLTRDAIPMSEGIDLLRNVLQALQHAHEHGILHRDIKPENILLASGTAVVADFGIAKALFTSRTQALQHTLTQAGTVIGTPAYMAPEQAAGDPSTDFRADLYAWGVVAYEVLTGAHPFARHVTPHAMITAHMTEVPTVLRAVAPHVPEGIAAAVSACLDKQPDRRPTSAGGALASFETYRTPVAFPQRPVRGNRARIMSAAVLLGLAVAAASWYAITSRSARGIARTLAVLPFDIGGDTANSYVADGISAELTTKLSRIKGLQVRAYTSSRVVRDQTPQTAARELGVGTLVTATVRRDRERLHVNASLIDGANARVLWSDTFDARDADQFALQDRLATAIARALEIRLSTAQQRAVQGTTTSDPVAHDLVQRSRYLADQLTAGAMAQAFQYAREAVTRDSSYADAWAALANAYVLQADDFEPTIRSMADMQYAAGKVASLNPDGAEGHALAGLIAGMYTRDTVTARKETYAALSIDSTNMYALMSEMTRTMARFPDSAAALQARTLRHNPMSTVALYFGAVFPEVFRALSPDTAVIMCSRLRRAVPPLGDNCDALRLWQSGRGNEARSLLRAADTTGFAGGLWSWRAYVVATVGDSAGARRVLARAELESRRRYVREDFMALAWSALGDRAQALRWAKAALSSRAAAAPFAYEQLISRFGTDSAFRAELNAVYGATAGVTTGKR